MAGKRGKNRRPTRPGNFGGTISGALVLGPVIYDETNSKFWTSVNVISTTGAVVPVAPKSNRTLMSPPWLKVTVDGAAFTPASVTWQTNGQIGIDFAGNPPWTEETKIVAKPEKNFFELEGSYLFAGGAAYAQLYGENGYSFIDMEKTGVGSDPCLGPYRQIPDHNGWAAWQRVLPPYFYLYMPAGDFNYCCDETLGEPEATARWIGQPGSAEGIYIPANPADAVVTATNLH